MHESQRGLEARIVQVGIVVAELIRQEHALVDDGAAGQRDNIEVLRLHFRGNAVRGHAPRYVKRPLEAGFVLHKLGPANENLPVARLDGDDAVGQPLVLHGHVAPAQQRDMLLLKHFRDDVFATDADPFVAGQEELPHGIGAGRG